MKILYGVQGTGNGHITRARGMSEQLSAAGIEVDYVFSGRTADKYYAMEIFGDWRWLNGLSFSVVKGKVKPLSTLFTAKPGRLIRDIKSLELGSYDLIISDFEPVTAWAAKRQNLPSLGIGHQYAFDYSIPKAGGNPLTRTIMRQFAPTQYSLGMHWYHYQQAIVPPIIDVWQSQGNSNPQHIIVYLPFESDREVSALLRQLPDYHFLYYGAFSEQKTVGNITYNPVSRVGFQIDLAKSGGVISNAGFELASESISLGKKLLVKPLLGQMEQISNGLALQNLDLGRCTKTLSPGIIRHWLDHFVAKRITYPNVAKHVVEWIRKGDLSNKEPLIEQLWAQTDSHGLPGFMLYGKSRRMDYSGGRNVSPGLGKQAEKIVRGNRN